MNEEGIYRDRREAGRILARHVLEQIRPAHVVVIALPRGGVPVGDEIASAMDAPLDILVVRKLGVPRHPEVAMGAIAAGGFELLNESLIRELGIGPFAIAAAADCEVVELARRERLYRQGRLPLDLVGQTLILVDDGIATGFTLRVAIAALRHRGAAHLIVAAPVGSREACVEIASQADQLVCPFQPQPFGAVGNWYRDFAPTSDGEVREILAQRMQRCSGSPNLTQ